MVTHLSRSDTNQVSCCLTLLICQDDETLPSSERDWKGFPFFSVPTFAMKIVTQPVEPNYHFCIEVSIYRHKKKTICCSSEHSVFSSTRYGQNVEISLRPSLFNHIWTNPTKPLWSIHFHCFKPLWLIRHLVCLHFETFSKQMVPFCWSEDSRRGNFEEFSGFLKLNHGWTGNWKTDCGKKSLHVHRKFSEVLQVPVKMIKL